MLLEHFTNGTQNTKTLSSIGMEIETDFLFYDGRPLTPAVTDAILKNTDHRPHGCQVKLELGVQKIELSINPQPTFSLLMKSAMDCLYWLYDIAQRWNAYPVHEPVISCNRELLYVQDERDALWVDLDGKPALEHLCRCSSVQFTIAVNPNDAIKLINRLWKARVHIWDYAPNNEKWLKYLHESKAHYRPNRYAGPQGFYNLMEYADELSKHDVIMHKGRAVRLNVDQVSDLDVELFLRSVWWHYRLRRYGDTLTLEIRPFARREDESIPWTWERVRSVLAM